MKIGTILKVIGLAVVLLITGCENQQEIQIPTLEQILGIGQPVPKEGFEPPKNPNKIDAKLSIDLGKTKPVKRKILGNNIQWIDRGDELLEGNTLNFSQDKVNKVKAMGVTFLRYPGGTLADLYHWKDGLGPQGNRKRNLRSHIEGDDVLLMGTVEFLTLTKELGAEPLITVNMGNGTPKEAAEWVRQVNIIGLKDPAGNPLPKVKYWEIGNEPYLEHEVHKHIRFEPEEFARNADATIKAMKAVDPSIVVGIPLRSDKIGSLPATPFQGFNDKVLKTLKQPFEFVALHNAYFPMAFEKVNNINNLYHATMSARKFVKKDTEETLAMLNKYFPGKKFEVAITEYNAFFTMNQGFTDGLISSIVGAVYCADMLTLFAEMDEITMANYWSLSGNWEFGALRQDGKMRPSYHVLEGFSRIYKGEMVVAQTSSPMFKGAKAGFIPDSEGTPSISAVVTRNSGKLTAFVVNKNISQGAKLALEISGGKKLKSIKMQTLQSDKFKSQDVSLTGWSSFVSLPVDQPVSISAHSIAIIEMELS